MATRKQQKRRHKRMVHGMPERTPTVSKPRARDDGDRPEKKPKARQASSSRRSVPEPSLQRSAKRGALLFVVMVVAFYLIDSGTKDALYVYVAEALLPAILFVPVSYLLDRVIYRKFAAQQ